MAINRRKALGTLAAGTMAHSCSITNPKRQQPNILFIMTDDHSARFLGCYGNEFVKTPNMDRLAADGARFLNAFVTNSLCAPSRATVLTGAYSHKHGIYGNSEAKDAVEHMADGMPTYPQLLQKAGYRTGIVGKWHLADPPAGFDYSCVLPGQGDYFNPIMHENGEAKRFVGYATDVTTDLALKFLQQPSDKPWCLVYQHKAPHRPFLPPEKLANAYLGKELPYPETFHDDYATRKVAREALDMRIEESLPGDYKDMPPGLSAAEKKKWVYQRFIKDYCGAIASIDENLGRVLKYLDSNKLTEETLIIYTSDNGFFAGDHGWYDKRFMYEPSLRVPLIIKAPTAPKARLPEHLVVNIDLAPTILDYAGVTAPASMQGRSLRAIINGGQQRGWRDSVYYAYYENSWQLAGKSLAARSDPGFQFFTPHRIGPHRGVRTVTHKLIHYYSDGDYWELFDLRKDPNELQNIYGQPEVAALTAQLKSELARLRQQYQDTA